MRNFEPENLRDLLHYLKYKDESDKDYQEYDKVCREKLYDMVTDNVKYFVGDVYCNLDNVVYMLPSYTMNKLSPKEIYELQNRFNKSATGIYGLKYDNQTNLALMDLYGNPYLMYVFTEKDNYDFNFYNMNGQGLLYSFSEPKDSKNISTEHFKELRKLRDFQIDYFKKKEADRNRYQEIKKYSEYIDVRTIGSGYVHMLKEVHIKKNIPIKLSENEIAKYADGWNYCFGGNITKMDEDENETVYRVKIHTD